MSAHNLVIVESPAKAKTINKYLGSDYTVVASYGHVRDLPPKDGSVRPEEGFAMSWQMGERSTKPVNEIVKLAKKADTIYLATDPDREGEAISWHVCEILKDKNILDKATVRRVTFNEITKRAVQEAFEQARDLDTHLIDAYLARRALDYLVGFSLSPVLWRKIPGARSAGRVQSVALRLICERESEIEAFDSEEYWSIETQMAKGDDKSFKARLFSLDSEKLDKMAIGDEKTAMTAVDRIKSGEPFKVASVERRQVRRHPAPPFITSTLQQEASRKLRFGATKTMRTAQRLYEGTDIGGETVGLITYMRTDGVTLSQDAVTGARSFISKKFGKEYVPDSPRAYKSKAKNAQEAHEAIRPTDLNRTPEDMRAYLNDDEARLYELIWKRTIACQMESAVLDQVTVDIASKDSTVGLRATGSIVVFDGFFKVYREDEDDKSEDEGEDDNRLPQLAEGDTLKLEDVTPNQHFTQPPPRYTEASLVKKLEELGIGRPSTYATILQVLQDRDYVVLDKRRFVPENRGRLVIAFLSNFFKQYVEYNFTADLETKLDDISAGTVEWKDVLQNFWQDFSKVVEETKGLTMTEVIDALDADLEPFLFPVKEGEEGKDPRKCPNCEDGRLSLKLGRYGAFVGCSNYPNCRFTRPFLAQDGDPEAAGDAGPRELGADPETGLPVSLRRGPYGPYVQLGPREKTAEEIKEENEAIEAAKAEAEKTGKKPKKPKKKKEPKPKRTAIPKGMDPDSIELERALQLLSLPRDIGPHPDTGEMIKAGIGRYGPYVVHQGKFKSIPATDDPDSVLTIGLNRAVDLLAQQGKGGFGMLREIGKHPEDGEPVTLNRGRYGPYIKHGKTNAPVPKDVEQDDITLEQAVEWIAAKKAKAAAGGGKKGKGGKKKKAT